MYNGQLTGDPLAAQGTWEPWVGTIKVKRFWHILCPFCYVKLLSRRAVITARPLLRARRCLKLLIASAHSDGYIFPTPVVGSWPYAMSFWVNTDEYRVNIQGEYILAEFIVYDSSQNVITWNQHFREPAPVMVEVQREPLCKSVEAPG